MPGFHVDEGLRKLIPPLSEAELQQLEANLVRDGCRDPLVIWNEKGVLLDGHHRYAICSRLTIPYRTERLKLPDRKAAQAWVIQNQFGRRNLTPMVRGELALKLEPLIAETAKARQRDGGKKKLVQNSAQAGKTRDTVAKVAGISHDTLSKIKVITEKAPESVKEKLRAGNTTINREYKAIVQSERKAEQIKKVAAVSELPTGTFHVIVADPPWPYSKRPNDSTHRGATPYPSMTITEISQMAVSKIAEPDSILWLWATNAFMVEAHEVARAWGFEVKTILTWAKDRMGVGDWLRGQTEHCLMAIKGKPVVNLTNQTTLLNGPMREHSRKPNEFYTMVDALCIGRKCELFSREERKGWKSFGAEIGKF